MVMHLAFLTGRAAIGHFTAMAFAMFGIAMVSGAAFVMRTMFRTASVSFGIGFFSAMFSAGLVIGVFSTMFHAIVFFHGLMFAMFFTGFVFFAFMRGAMLQTIVFRM